MTLTINTDVKQIARRFPNLLAESISTAIKNWHQQVMPGHFRSGAFSKYGYARRVPRYLASRKKRGKPPLVYSGQSRRMLSLPMSIVKSKGTVKGKFNVPNTMRYFWMRGRNHPDMPKELKAMTQAERDQFSDQVKEMTADKIRSMQGTSRRKES